MTKKIYRARGKYDLSNKDSWVTTVWRRTKKEAEDDLKMFTPGRYKNIRVVEEDYNTFLKKNQRPPRF